MIPVEEATQLQEGLINWDQSSHGLIGMRHSSQQFSDIIAESGVLVRDLLQVPAHYHVLWAPGGATQQFSIVLLNLPVHCKSDYLDTGYWANIAAKESVKFRDISD